MTTVFVAEVSFVSKTRLQESPLCRGFGKPTLFHRMKVAVEPACATSTAALLGPLRDQLRDKRVVLLLCGSNIDWQTFAEQALLQVDDAA